MITIIIITYINMTKSDRQNSLSATFIRILLVDNHRLFRQCLRLLLEQEPGIQVLGEAKGGQEAVIMATEMSPDMVILDSDIEDMPGPKAARLIHERLPGTKILMLSAINDEKKIMEGISTEMVGCILKDVDNREFLKIIKNIMDEKPMNSPFLITLDQKASSPLTPLTNKEREILKYLSEPMSNKEIAQVMGLSPETIKSHLHRIYTKLRVGSRAEAMRLFYGHSQSQD